MEEMILERAATVNHLAGVMRYNLRLIRNVSHLEELLKTVNSIG